MKSKKSKPNELSMIFSLNSLEIVRNIKCSFSKLISEKTEKFQYKIDLHKILETLGTK